MTLSKGDHVAKLKRDWSKEGGGKVVDPPTLQENEMYVEFEVVEVGTQGEEPFPVTLKKVR